MLDNPHARHGYISTALRQAFSVSSSGGSAKSVTDHGVHEFGYLVFRISVLDYWRKGKGAKKAGRRTGLRHICIIFTDVSTLHCFIQTTRHMIVGLASTQKPGLSPRNGCRNSQLVSLLFSAPHLKPMRIHMHVYAKRGRFMKYKYSKVQRVSAVLGP